MALESFLSRIELSYTYVVCTTISLLLAYYFLFHDPGLYPTFPAAGVDNEGFSRLSKAKENWSLNGKDIIVQGRKRFAGCFQVFTSLGPKIVLPNRFADEIRNNPHMHFGKAIEMEFFGGYPGFEPFQDIAESNVLVETVRGKLTQSLNYVTEELSDETSKSLLGLFGEPEEWTEVVFKPKILQLVARISSRVFLGPEMCENEEWLAISKEYAIDAFIAARALRQWPSLLRPIVHWFMPECRKIRAELKKARQILMPVVERRREEYRKARDSGHYKPSKVADTIVWLDDTAKGRPYDAALAQLGLSFAAIHTTTEMISGLLGDLCANPEYFEPLRQEISTVLEKKGWQKSSLHELKFMDSVMKESQRHHFGDIAAMTRLTEEQIVLSDGTVIPKGALTMVSLESMQDTSIFPEPNAFKGRRFLDMREQPGSENRWQFVTTSPEHLAFGHGKHACPGRFFASNEIKVALCHLLMKYDWQLPSEGRKEDKSFGQETDTDPTAKIMYRTRKEEIYL